MAVSLCSEFLLVTCFALGVAVGKVGCTKLVPRPLEQDAQARLHTFGLSLWAFGCHAGRSDAPLCCKDLPCIVPSTGGLRAGSGFGRR